VKEKRFLPKRLFACSLRLGLIQRRTPSRCTPGAALVFWKIAGVWAHYALTATQRAWSTTVS
jgi:hypothetical protein